MGVISTSRGSAFAKWFSGCCLSSFMSKDMCGGFRSSVSQYLSRSRSFPRSISNLLTVIYSAGVGVVPKGNQRQIKASLSTIYIQVKAIVVFALIWR